MSVALPTSSASEFAEQQYWDTFFVEVRSACCSAWSTRRRRDTTSDCRALTRGHTHAAWGQAL